MHAPARKAPTLARARAHASRRNRHMERSAERKKEGTHKHNLYPGKTTQIPEEAHSCAPRKAATRSSSSRCLLRAVSCSTLRARSSACSFATSDSSCKRERVGEVGDCGRFPADALSSPTTSVRIASINGTTGPRNGSRPDPLDGCGWPWW
eukprot:3935910-Rhodomonas_salina.1